MKIDRDIRKIIKVAIEEDIGSGDITTTNFINQSDRYRATMIAKSPCILCGVDIAALVFKFLCGNCKITFFKKDGQMVKKGEKIMEIIGTRRIFEAERTALNFIQHLSGIATKTYRFVKLAKKYDVKIFDTRKTLPGLRKLQKYAVKTGGGENHRFGLYEHFMIKDNHLMALRNNFDLLALKIKEVRKKYKDKKIEIEVQNIKELENILKLKPDIIMLDNMEVSDIKEAILKIRKVSRKVEIEISGGINENNIKKFLNLGIDRISIGALTHSVEATDISLEIEGIFGE